MAGQFHRNQSRPLARNRPRDEGFRAIARIRSHQGVPLFITFTRVGVNDHWCSDRPGLRRSRCSYHTRFYPAVPHEIDERSHLGATTVIDAGRRDLLS